MLPSVVVAKSLAPDAPGGSGPRTRSIATTSARGRDPVDEVSRTDDPTLLGGTEVSRVAGSVAKRHLTQAERLVVEAELRVARQRALVEKLAERGRDTAKAEAGGRR